jgi:hypothetical protein
MMDDTKFGPGYGSGFGSGFPPGSGYGPASGPAASLPEPPVDDEPGPSAPSSAADASAAPTADLPEVDPAVEKFRSCRWRATPDAGEYCTHRDVLPFAGKEGFKPESWCPECAFYKLRRTPKKRDKNDYMY